MIPAFAGSCERIPVTFSTCSRLPAAFLGPRVPVRDVVRLLADASFLRGLGPLYGEGVIYGGLGHVDAASTVGCFVEGWARR